MFLCGGISPIFKSYIYLKSDAKMSSFSVCVFIEWEYLRRKLSYLSYGAIFSAFFKRW